MMKLLSFLNLGAILVSILFGVSGQLLLKTGMLRVNQDGGALGSLYARAVMQPAIWLGLVCFGISMLVWLFVLSRLEMSVAFPFLGLNYILIMIGARVFFGETIGLAKIGGTACIVLGILLIARDS
jgi:multidrug transporter EmrE-like cation transporter